MSRARLVITADAESVKKMFADLKSESKAVAQALGGVFGTQASRAKEAGAKMRQDALGNLAAIERAEENRAQRANRRKERVKKVYVEEGHTLGMAYRDAAKQVTKSEEQITRDTERESAKRRREAEREAAKKIAEARRVEAAEKRAEREKVAAHKRALSESEKATKQAMRAQSERRGAIGGVIGGAVAGMTGALVDLHGDAQGARARRSTTRRTLGLALYQTGAWAPEIKARMGRLTQFAQHEGIDADEIAGAANAVQTEFASLGEKGMSGGQREKLFEKFLSRVRTARNLGVDTAEYTRFAGMLDQQKLDDSTKDQILRYSVGASQKGAVELGSITRESMGAIQSRIALAQSTAKSRGMSRGQATEEAVRQAYAELQIAKGLGVSPRKAGEAMASLNDALQNPVVQQKMLQNIRSKLGSGSALEKNLFEVGADGKDVLKSQFRNALPLAERMQSMGVDPVAFKAMFAGGGHGNPQSMQANWRRLAGALTGVDNEGITYAQRVRDLMDPKVGMTEEDERRGAGAFDDDLAALTRNQETNLNALTDNTGGLKTLSDQFADWAARNPLASKVAGAGVTGAGLWAALTQNGRKFAANLFPKVGTTALRLAGGAAFLSDFLHSTDVVSGSEERDGLTRNTWNQWTPAQRAAKIDMISQNFANMGAQMTAPVGALAANASSQFLRDTFAARGDKATDDAQFVRVLSIAIEQGMSKAVINIPPQAVEHARSSQAARTPRTPTQ